MSSEKKQVFIIGSKGIPAQYGGFETFVDVDQEVKKGDLLLKFDIDLVKEKGYSTETMMSFELADKRTLQMQYTGQTQGKDVVAVVK